MGLFNFFKKKQNEKAESNTIQETNKTNSDIEIISIDNGSHGDNFGGLIGFNYLNTEEGSQYINELMALSATKESVLKNSLVSIKEANINPEKLKIRTLTSKDAIISAYPYLQTDYTVPFSTKQIFEWSHIDHLEAEIKGSGRDTFGFGFFATDYAVNKNKYKSNKNLNIKVSAIGLVLDKSEFTEINGHEVSEGFASYMPSKDILRPTYYDFIGVLIDHKPILISNKNSGYIIKVKLINEESNPNFFAVDMFINKENMRISVLEKGMKISGALWFQGEIE